MSTLSKKQRKMLRQQMHDRKQQLLAKHRQPHHDHPAASAKPTVNDRGSASTSSSGGGGGFAAMDRLGSHRPFANLSPAPRWKPPTPAERALPPQVVAHAGTTLPATRPPHVVPAVRDLDGAGPGPLTRTAASVERSVRKAIDLYYTRPWRRPPVTKRADAHRALAVLVKPLRWMGCAAVLGAFALGRESRGVGVSDTGSLVVLGMGLGLAVVLLALAEMTAALRVMVTRR